LCDTNGGCLPNEIAAITKTALGKLNCKIGIHTHDDIGLGVANALAALETGAVHVQGTINGYGERTGNCNLTSVIPCVALKLKKTSVPVKSLAKLKELSGFVDEVANMRHNPRLPWVGAAAFAHKGGAHVNAVQKLASSYEHIDPSLVGNARNVLISDLAGRSNIVIKAQELGFKLTNDTPELKAILNRVKELENQGYEYEAAEGSLALLIGKALKHRELPFTVNNYHVSMDRTVGKSVCKATVEVHVGKRRAKAEAKGDGPVNALDGALRLALAKFFPQLKKVTLTDYKVRILTPDLTKLSEKLVDTIKKSKFIPRFSKEQRSKYKPKLSKVFVSRIPRIGTAAKTRVLIESSDGKREWGTVGVSENIIEASLQALVDSMEFALLKK
jgi:2-isopropylmalate synthase